jgi:taurine dioxygenase
MDGGKLTWRERRFDDAPLGGEVIDIDLTRPLAPHALAELKRTLAQFQVAVFRDQHLSPRQHVEFSRQFGPLQVHVLHQFHLAGFPEILVVSNVVEQGRQIGLGDAGRNWHSDLSYLQRPSLGSFLHAQEIPADDRHGQTWFANMALAYDTLPLALRSAIQGRRAVHSYLHRYSRLQQQGEQEGRNWRPQLSSDQREAVPEVTHPIVRTHPETGRKSLFVSEGFATRIEGLPADESDSLLEQLFAHSVREEHLYRHRWRPHDLVFWDNRSTIHFAPKCPSELRRTLYRTTVEGDEPQ